MENIKKEIETISLIVLLFLSINSFSQEKEIETIKFKVEESKNNPLPGVSTYIKGTTIETTTDFNGEAFLKLENKNQSINISFYIYQFSFKLINHIDFVYIDIASRQVTFYKNGKKIKKKRLKLDEY